MDDVCEQTGVAIIARGSYQPPNKKLEEGERRLYLLIEGNSKAFRLEENSNSSLSTLILHMNTTSPCLTYKLLIQILITSLRPCPSPSTSPLLSLLIGPSEMQVRQAVLELTRQLDEETLRVSGLSGQSGSSQSATGGGRYSVL